MRIALGIFAVVTAASFWILLGSRIAVLADRLFTGPATNQPIDQFAIEAKGRLVVGKRSWPIPNPTLGLDSNARVVATIEGKGFTFGPVQQRWQDEMQFVPEKGDTVSLSRFYGRMRWPTPLYGLFTLTSPPKWKRHAYDRLRWIKSTGASLEILWRDEQRLWLTGWTDEFTNEVASLIIQ